MLTRLSKLPRQCLRVSERQGYYDGQKPWFNGSEKSVCPCPSFRLAIQANIPSSVEWVYENIAAFNGDPERLTLWGQSAGGASVDSYGYAYPNNPIVKGLIADSGSAYLLSTADTTQKNFTALAGMVGCKDLAPDAELRCMRNVSATVIEDALSNYVNSGVTPTIAFTPVADNITAFSNPADRAAKGLGVKLVSFCYSLGLSLSRI